MLSSSVSPPPTPFNMSSEPASTAPSSPPPDEDSDLIERDSSPSRPISIEEQDAEKRFARLKYVLEKSAVYSRILKARMDEDKARQQEERERRRNASARKSVASPRKTTRRRANLRTRKRQRLEDTDSDDDSDVGAYKRQKIDDDHVQELDEDDPPIFPQPKLVTGAKLKNYQLEGLQWMVSLDQNGISGILADEMGLGKTLQTIAFSAYFREQKVSKPFLIVCPLSVLHNWVDEYAKFAPTIPVCMYHGTPAERAELRRTVMRPPTENTSKKDSVSSTNDNNKGDQESKTKAKGKGKGKTRPKAPAYTKTKIKNNVGQGPRRSSRFAKDAEEEVVEIDEEESVKAEIDDEGMEVDENGPSGDVQVTEDSDDQPSKSEEPSEEELSFPVILTTYEIIMKDRIHLAAYDWGYIVVDEGHRLKNLDCKLMREIKKYSSASRMILTGTPLHNNLAELWSLLNFILPDLFNDVDSFQEWFNLPTMQSSIGSDKSSEIVSSLHAILKPFLLRRLKVDVESNLPPKKEYVLYAPLTVRQREVYDSVLRGGLRAHLIGDEGKKTQTAKKDLNGPRKLRSGGKGKGKGKGKRKSYAVDGDDDEYFEMLEKGELETNDAEKKDDIEEIGRQHQYKTTLKQVNNMKLQNTVMQLRKVCSHPFLFDWPLDSNTRQPVLNEELVNVSGKMMVLDRLLAELFKRKHKVLLFSQFTTMLDIIEDWASEYKGYKICRIDGSTAPLDRREEMKRFQNGGNAPDAPCLFLLSTRAGGLGINLVAADTVIFYDQDWNPQMDAQAQDRAHRIGQTKPVLIFRLVSAHTIETKIMQRATEKRKLEALVIAKGKFKMPSAVPGQHKPGTMAEMAASLLELEGEKIDVVPNTAAGKASVLSDEDLEMLLDRRPEVFANRGKGWTSAGEIPVGDDGESGGVLSDRQINGKKAAFAVYHAPVDEGNEALAKMLGEDVE